MLFILENQIFDCLKILLKKGHYNILDLYKHFGQHFSAGVARAHGLCILLSSAGSLAALLLSANTKQWHSPLKITHNPYSAKGPSASSKQLKESWMEPFCISVVPSCFPNPGGLAAVAGDTASSFLTAPSIAGQTHSLQAAPHLDGPFTPSCSYWHCGYISSLGQAAWHGEYS